MVVVPLILTLPGSHVSVAEKAAPSRRDRVRAKHRQVFRSGVADPTQVRATKRLLFFLGTADMHVDERRTREQKTRQAERPFGETGETTAVFW